jgi:hypothetical protein
MKKWLAQCLIIIILPIACNKATEITVPGQTPILVVNGQWQQKAVFMLRVTRSRGITDPFDTGAALFSTYEVRNALVTIKESNIVVDTLKYDSTSLYYRSIHNKRTKLNAVYTVNASVTGFASVSVTTPLLSLMTISGAQLKTGVSYNSSGNSMDQVAFSFSDDESQTDYYLIHIRKSDGNFAECVNTTDQDFEKLIYTTPFTTETCFDGDKLLLSDKNFNGRTKNVVLSVPTDQMKDMNIAGEIRHPYVELLHITEDFFKYIRSNNNYDISGINPFAEPANIYSNITNGYGFFTAYSLATDSLHK